MSIDQTVLAAVIAFIGGPLVSLLVQGIKTVLKLSGVGAIILTGVVALGGTAYVLVSLHAFTILAFIIYGAIVVGEATGLYHFTPVSSTGIQAKAEALKLSKTI